VISRDRTTLTSSDVVSAQRSLCEEKGYDYTPAGLDSKLGFAIRTQGKIPINGLRHPPAGDTNGWYIWSGTSGVVKNFHRSRSSLNRCTHDTCLNVAQRRFGSWAYRLGAGSWLLVITSTCG
jgi:hypothetical protein